MDTMGLHDDIFYTTVEIPVESYQRIKYFQSELQDLYTRFERIFEKLPTSVKLSDRSLVSISNAVQHLTNSMPMLFMFGPTHSKIPIRCLVQNDTPNQRRTHPLEEMHHLDIHVTNYKMVLAMCTLRMMDTKRGRDALRKVESLFGTENMMFYVDSGYELNMDMVVNTLALLENLLELDIKVVFESKMEIISNDINNHIENKFVNTFVSLNKFLLEITKKRSRTSRSTFGDKRTGGRFYRDIKRQFENASTVIDLLVTSRGETTEQKLATAIVAFTKTLVISEIAETYEMQDVQVFDYCQRQNFTDIWTVVLQKHLNGVPLVRIFDQLVRMPNDELARRDIENNYTLDDANTIGKEVTQALMGYLLELGTNVKEIRVNLDLLTLLRKELLRLIEETLVGDKYVERVPNLDNWRKQILGIRDVKKLDIVFGKLVVFVNIPESTEREKEVRKQVKKSLKGFPSEVVVECVSYIYHAGRHGNGTYSKIDMGDAFLSEGESRGTIGLFMKEYGTEQMDLHFVTSSHAVVGSKVVKTNDQSPVLLGTIRHSLFTDDGLVDVAAIRVEDEIRTRCNIFFKENDEIRKCKILDINAIQTLKEGKHVYKRGSTTGETKGCIISEDFSTGSGLKDHSFLVGLPVGSDEAALSKGFAQEGDSGAVLYTKAPDGEVQYVGLLMGKYTLRDETDSTSSTFKSLTKEVGSLILTTCLQEGLNRIEQKFNFKLALPT
ncbi:hypothetical protein ACJMK2_012418 [Sinanodonta woodiana]|uniref:Uncharacterized protein n=1 Tax=Sinanodonta woodiana TaxID=1069815 RepID=A0ABD3VB66_SINWO